MLQKPIIADACTKNTYVADRHATHYFASQVCELMGLIKFAVIRLPGASEMLYSSCRNHIRNHSALHGSSPRAVVGLDSDAGSYIKGDTTP